MVGPFRLVALALALAALSNPAVATADDPKPQAPVRPSDRPTPADLAFPGEDPPAVFVPKAPRTVAQQKQVEALRLYVEALALEKQLDLVKAIAVMEKALALEPDSIPILRGLWRLYKGRGQIDRAVEYGRRVIATEPSDLATVDMLLEFYNKNREPAKAESFLKEVLANPKLDKASPQAIVLEFELAKLYAATQQITKAADSLTKVIDAIDSKLGNRLSPADRRRVLGDNESFAYFRFGQIFFEAKRRDLAIRCFRRAEVYDDANPQLPLLLANLYLVENQPAEALAQVEKALARKGQGPEVIQLLAVILSRLNREKEFLPRLEAAVKADSRNVALRYALSDRYRAAGMVDKADALLRTLLEGQPGLQAFPNLFASQLKDKKTEDLLQLLEKVYERTKRVELIDPQIDALIADPAYVDKVLDTGLAMLDAKPPRLDDQLGPTILARIAVKAGKSEKHIELLRWVVKERPSPMAWRELVIALLKPKRYGEAVAAAEAMMAKYPDERNPDTLVWFSAILVEAGREDEAVVILKDILKQLPNNPIIIRNVAQALSHKGKTDEAVAVLRDALQNNPVDEELIRSMAFTLRQAGRINDEITFLKSLAEKYPNNAPIFSLSHSLLSIAYTDLGDFAKGEAELEILYAKEPESALVNNDLGYLYAEQGKNLEKAEAMIRKAVEQDPESSAYLDSLGWVLFKRGKLKEAVPPLEKAIDMLDREGRDDATIPEHLGDVFFALKDRAKARAAWEKAEKVSAVAKPPDKRLAEIRKKLESLKKLDNGPKPATGANP